MENTWQKKMPCEEKKVFALKMASENAFKKRGRILKFKIKQKVFKKKYAEWYI